MEMQMGFGMGMVLAKIKWATQISSILSPIRLRKLLILLMCQTQIRILVKSPRSTHLRTRRAKLRDGLLSSSALMGFIGNTERKRDFSRISSRIFFLVASALILCIYCNVRSRCMLKSARLMILFSWFLSPPSNVASFQLCRSGI